MEGLLAVAVIVLIVIGCGILGILIYHMVAGRKELEKARREAVNANLQMAEFMSKVSHDIRTPLQVILQMIDVAKKNADDVEKLQKCHDKIELSAKELLEAMESILNMNRAQSEQLVFSEDVIDIRRFFVENNKEVTLKAADQGIKMHASIRGKIDYPYVSGSLVHLRQIYNCLLSNAIKFNVENGEVECELWEQNGTDENVEVCFAITDTGIGMSEEFLSKHLYKPFMQEKSGNERTAQGTGMGLAIVKRLVDQMNGKIQCESLVNVGTKFKVTIPMKICEAPHEDYAKEVISLDSMKILVVEDHKLNREIMVNGLEKVGACVVTASNGEHALQIYENSAQDEFQMIVMDIVMPVMDGIKATKLIRGMDRLDAKRIPIIAISANAFEEDKRKCKEAGMNEYLAKPVQMEQLVEIAEKYRIMMRRERRLAVSEAMEKKMADLQYLAVHDAFTNVYNKNSFFDIVDKYTNKSAQEGYVMMVYDLDNFKKVNDTLGHHVGDEVILALAEILKASFRGEDYVGRFGGDEFMVFMPQTINGDIGTKRAHVLLADIESYFQSKYDGFGITASAGVVHGRKQVSASELFQIADEQLYQAKKNGKNCYSYIEI